jgi:hypothetical protein
MSRLPAHLVRGAIAAALIAWALRHWQTQPALAVAAGVVAVLAMKGCPACWMLGLFVTIRETAKAGGLVRRPADR